MTRERRRPDGQEANWNYTGYAYDTTTRLDTGRVTVYGPDYPALGIANAPGGWSWIRDDDSASFERYIKRCQHKTVTPSVTNDDFRWKLGYPNGHPYTTAGGHVATWQRKGYASYWLNSFEPNLAHLPCTADMMSDFMKGLRVVKPMTNQFGVSALELREAKDTVDAFVKMLKSCSAAFGRKKRIAGAYLAAIFGVLPLGGDIVSGSQMIRDVQSLMDRFAAISGQTMKHSVQRFYEDEYNCTQPTDQITPSYGVRKYFCYRRKKITVYKLSGTVKYPVIGISDTLAFKILRERYGLGSFLTSMYEAVPFSFVVDWFANIGGLLAELEHAVDFASFENAIEIHPDLCWSVKTSAREWYKWYYPKDDRYPAKTLYPEPRFQEMGSVGGKWFERGPGWPPWSTETSGSSGSFRWNRAVTGAAIITQVMSK